MARRQEDAEQRERAIEEEQEALGKERKRLQMAVEDLRKLRLQTAGRLPSTASRGRWDGAIQSPSAD